MKVLKKNKGFTLVELIVVIAIIGILAAVLIPSVTGYITKARKSNDVQVAGQMTQAVSLYTIENNIDQSKLLGTDVRTILLSKGFDLIPSTDKWVFIYDVETKKVQVVDVNRGGMVEAADDFVPTDPTNIASGKFLVSKGKSLIERAVDMLCNMKDIDDYAAALALLEGEDLSDYRAVLGFFDPEETMYISNIDYFTSAGNGDKIKRIVLLDRTYHLPKITTEAFLEVSTVPQIIKTSDNEKTSKIGRVFPKAKKVTEGMVKQIDLSDFNPEKGNYKIRLGAYAPKALAFDFYDDIVRKDSDGQIVRKLIVSYFNENGLFARGEVEYTYTEPDQNPET